MGLRITDNLKKSDFAVRHVEVSDRGREALAAKGVTAVDLDNGLDGADVVILAIPDRLIGQVSHQIAPKLKAGTMLVVLDAAAPHAGEMPERTDLTYFVTHPCHPPICVYEPTEAEALDFFGGIAAKQHIVCALMQGPEEHYPLGEQVSRTIFAPVMNAHRCTVEQIAILEPALSETVGATCIQIVKEAVDEAARRGVPYEAARDFMLGHLKIEIAICFQLLEGLRFSDGALKAIEDAKQSIFQPDWKKVFEPEAVKESVLRITRG
jgi:hypothetical protein